jgi:antitoxin component of RelBE/YafQ-DinJ toxin-antitoxin module
MITQVIVNVDSLLKAKAMKKAKREGIPFSSVIKMAIKAFVDDRFDVGLIGNLNTKTSRELRQALRDIDKGKNLSPVLHTVDEMRKYLDNV